MKGKLYLIPLPLAEDCLAWTIPAEVAPLAKGLKHFIVESEKVSRRYLKKLDRSINIDELKFLLLNEHTPESESRSFLQAALEGQDVGLMSDAGCPAVADPGALVVALAHKLGIQVVPLTGPNSILLTLMGSGFNGQCFAFQGYLPVDKVKRKQRLLALETESRQKRMTMLFIETPYRNNQMLETLLQSCHPDTRLCIGTDLTAETELLKSMPVRLWQKEIPDLHKRPTVFAIYAG